MWIVIGYQTLLFAPMAAQIVRRALPVLRMDAPQSVLKILGTILAAVHQAAPVPPLSNALLVARRLFHWFPCVPTVANLPVTAGTLPPVAR